MRLNKLIAVGTVALTVLSGKGQNIYTLAGNGTFGFSGDGGQATMAQLNQPYSVTRDATGNIYLADAMNHRVRKITPAGIISTIAGNGIAGFSGDGGLATAAQLDQPRSVTVDGSGNIYIADMNNNRIRKISSTGSITTVAGSGAVGFGGDGGLATSAKIWQPNGVAVDASGNLYITDTNNQRIRKVNTSGTITTVAGNGVNGFGGDGGVATSAALSGPTTVTVDASGNIYIADYFNHRIRKVSSTGTITTIAGTGTGGYGGDGAAATAAQLKQPWGVNIDGVGNIYIADAGNQRIRKINSGGIIATIAGTGSGGYSGDGGLATAAKLNIPTQVYADAAGAVYIADYSNQRVRVICPSACALGTEKPDELSIGTLIYPNPNNGNFTLKVTEVSNVEVELNLFNSLGQNVHSQTVFAGNNEIKGIALSEGIYQYQLLVKGAIIASGKVIVR